MRAAWATRSIAMLYAAPAVGLTARLHLVVHGAVRRDEEVGPAGLLSERHRVVSVSWDSGAVRDDHESDPAGWMPQCAARSRRLEDGRSP